MGRTNGARYLLPLGALALLGMVSSLYATRRGVGLTSDSVYYLGTARSLLDGRGFVTQSPVPRPVTDWPPLFPSLLAAFGLLGLSLRVGARWLNAGLFGATILLAGLAIRHVTSGSLRGSVFCAFLMAASVDLLRVYSQAGSDPLFIFLAILGLVLLGAHLEQPKPRRLIGAGIAVGLAFLARYPGAVVVATGVLGLLLLGRRGWQARLADTMVFAGLSSFATGLWIVRNWLLTHRPVGDFRAGFAVHPLTPAQMKLGLNTLWGWFVPGRDLAGGPADLLGHLPGIRWAVVAAATAGGVVVALRWRHRMRASGGGSVIAETRAAPPLLWLLVIFLVLYGSLLVIDITFLDATLPLNWRLLSPAFVASLILGIGLGQRVLRVFSPLAERATVVGAALLVGAYADAALMWIRHAHDEGLEYGARVWQESDTLRKVTALPSGVSIYSNGQDIVTLVTGRLADELPNKVVLPTGRPNPTYQVERDAMRDRLRTGAVLVYLNRITWRSSLYGSEAELKDELHLRLRAAGADGSIYDVTP